MRQKRREQNRATDRLGNARAFVVLAFIHILLCGAFSRTAQWPAFEKKERTRLLLLILLVGMQRSNAQKEKKAF